MVAGQESTFTQSVLCEDRRKGRHPETWIMLTKGHLRAPQPSSNTEFCCPWDGERRPNWCFTASAMEKGGIVGWGAEKTPLQSEKGRRYFPLRSSEACFGALLWSQSRTQGRSHAQAARPQLSTAGRRAGAAHSGPLAQQTTSLTCPKSQLEHTLACNMY